MNKIMLKMLSMMLIIAFAFGVISIPICAEDGVSEEPQDDRNAFEVIYSTFLIFVGVILLVIATVELMLEYMVSSIGNLFNGIA